jgi:phosphatidylserine/phosphatidylglycerophosphate/cardiolipin synthase-like enzyme
MKMGRVVGGAVLAALLALGAGGRAGAAVVTNASATQVEAAFDGECERLLLREVPKAKQELLVAAYIITRAGIVDAICRAAERKVVVKLKYDERQAEYEGMKTALEKLRRAGASCTAISFASSYAQMHDKFIVIDRQRVLTGSFNFTSTAARENYENLVLIEAAKTAAEFARAFERIRTKN